MSTSMRVERSDVAEHKYTMFNNIMHTNAKQDIWVIIDCKLIFSEHLAEKTDKANKSGSNKNICISWHQ